MHALSFHEKKQHGTLEFPAEYYYIDATHPRYNMPFHWHKEWELIRIVKGSIYLHLDHQKLTAHAGDILLLPASMLHGGSPENCVYECFVFDLHGLFRNMELAKNILRPIYRLQIQPLIYYQRDAHPMLQMLIHNLMDAFSNAPVPSTNNVFSAFSGYRSNSDHFGNLSYQPQHLTPLLTIGILSQFFTYILKNNLYTINPQGEPTDSRHIGRIKSVLEYIELHYQSPITLDAMAEVAGMNPKYLCRIFKTLTQQTPMDYVIFYRIEQAAHLLSNTDLPITRIALECGFNDCSYFIRMFKRLKQLTPHQYRKMLDT